MQFTDQHLAYMQKNMEEARALLLELVKIPAPSGKEQQRAEFCLNWLKQQGAVGAYIDDVQNVILPIGCEGEGPISVFMAHSDTVFEDTEPFIPVVEDGRIRCPGVEDDTANVVALLMSAKYLLEQGLRPKDTGVLLVIDACEEGLGNLRGVKTVFEQYGPRIKELVSFDLTAEKVICRAVGSVRYRIEARTKGGHSYHQFGEPNAIVCLASLIRDLYAIPLPEMGKTTYNVGVIEGGTSVNTIPQYAACLYEFRSDEAASLQYMEEQFQTVLEQQQWPEVELTATLLGKRPCSGNVDSAAQAALLHRAKQAVKHQFRLEAEPEMGSTDCNLPLSLGIPSVCVGCILGGGAHTREEYIEGNSILPGLCTALELILYHF